jgi:hypothetical protein
VDGHELGTSYTWTAAVRAGLTRAGLRDDGVRVTRGAYVSRAVPLTVASACRAAGQVLPLSAVFSHLTAAALLGAPVTHAWPLEVSVPPGVARPQRRRLRVHRRTVGPEDVVDLGGLRLTSGSQTLLDPSDRLPPDELVAVGDALFRGKHLDHDRLDARLRRATGTDRSQFGRDLDRYSLMAAGGWLVLRFGAPHLHRRATVIDRVGGALRSRGARW